MGLLNEIAELWLKQLEICRKAKKKQFADTAAQIWEFMGKKYDAQLFAMEDPLQGYPEPPKTGKVPRTLNKAREFCSLMIPYVHHRVPDRLVHPRRPQIPAELAALAAGREELQAQDKTRAWLLEWFLNWTPGEYGLIREARTCLTEAFVKGRGVLWHELDEGPFGLIPVSTYGSVDHLFIDADCRQYRDAGFIMRERWEPAYRIAERFDLDPEKIRAAKGAKQTHLQQAVNHASEAEVVQEDGDLVVWYEVFSRVGIGHKFFHADEALKDKVAALEAIGPHAYIAVMPGIDHPLNLSPEVFSQADTVLDNARDREEFSRRLEWPIAFYEDLANPWPCTFLDFIPNSENPWASSVLEAALPLQVFMDRIYDYLTRRVRVGARTLIITSTELEEITEKVIHMGYDLEMAKTSESAARAVNDLIKVLEFPPVKQDILQVLALAERAWDKAVGTDPLIYGGVPDTQDRSAAATTAREGHLTRRPDDYADVVEEFHSQVAAKEAQAARMYVGPQTVAPLFGESVPEDGQPETWGQLTAMWAELVNTDSPVVASAELSYTVASNSGRRRNRQRELADAQTMLQTLGQFYFQYGAAPGGSFQPFNQLVVPFWEAYEMPGAPPILQDLIMQMAPPEGEENANV